MAKIVLSDVAPAEAINFRFASEPDGFTLGGSAKQSFETTNPGTVAEAKLHPWLVVEEDPQAEFGYEAVSQQVRPEDDPLSAHNSIAFDRDEVRKVEEAKGVAVQPLAVSPALDQTKAESVETPGGLPDVAVTIAADDSHEPAKTAKAFDLKEQK